MVACPSLPEREVRSIFFYKPFCRCTALFVVHADCIIVRLFLSISVIAPSQDCSMASLCVLRVDCSHFHNIEGTVDSAVRPKPLVSFRWIMDFW